MRHLHACQHPVADLRLGHGAAALFYALLHACGHTPQAVWSEPFVEVFPQVGVLLQPITCSAHHPQGKIAEEDLKKMSVVMHILLSLMAFPFLH